MDPSIYFFVDEIAISLRAYTLGYDLFHPHRILGRHLYNRSTRVTHWSSNSTAGVAERDHEAIEPVHDRLVMFNPRIKHEVKEVSFPSLQFEGSRFTLNGWVRRRSAVPADYFDAKIFLHRGSLRIGPLRDRTAPIAALKKQPAPRVNGKPSNANPGIGARARDLFAVYGDLFRQSRSSKSI